jgi:sorting nexin-7/30/sorting nexin-8
MEESSKDSTSENNLDSKKNYLTVEIINKNYNPTDFINFCVSKKENGDDLINWTLEELKQCVSEFQLQQQEKNIQINKSSMKNFLFSNNNNNSNNNTINNINSQNYLQSINENIQNSNFGSQSDDFYSQNNNIQKLYKKEIPCKILEKTELNSKKIKVEIKNPKTMTTSILSSSYTLYEIHTKELNYIVYRRYSDFEWLRAILRKLYPRHLIPPLPGKKMGTRRFDLDFIEKRMKFLQKFMDDVVNVESFKACEALVAFLKFNDREQFDRKIKEMNSIVCTGYVQDMKTLSGKIHAIDYDDNEKYYINIHNYFKLQIQIYNRLNYNMKNYYRNISSACKNLEDIQNDFDTLEKLNTKVQMKPEISKTFEELSIFFKNWGRILSNENEIIKEKIRDFFKYQKMENLSYLELIEGRNEIKEVYLSSKKRLDEKKTKLYAYNDINKWEIEENFNNINISLIYRDKNYAWEKMCTKDTQALEHLREQFGYANHMNFSQLRKMINKNCKLYVENTKDFANTFYPSLNDSITLWSTLNTYV